MQPQKSSTVIKDRLEQHRKTINVIQTVPVVPKRHKVEHKEYIKDDREKAAIANAKKEHNKLFFKLFGTKRPTAGIVKRHFNYA